jgi:hypothetical protein
MTFGSSDVAASMISPTDRGGRQRCGRLLLAVVLALVWVGGAGSAVATNDKREVQARKDFAAGRYQQAADLFAELFAELGDPVFLRNIGRCYQEMGRPSDAIRSFRYYLQKADVTPGERKEVEGFIAQLEKEQADHGGAAPSPSPAPLTPPPAAARPAAAPATPPPPVISPPPAAPPATAPAPTTDVLPPPPPPPLIGTETGAPAAAPATGPFYTRWWFWTGVGVVVAGGVVGALVARSNRGEVGDCHGISPCTQIGGN